jgi:hypothetical protein
MTNQNDTLDYWIGGEDRDNDGDWTWATSGNPITYSNWLSSHSLKVNSLLNPLIHFNFSTILTVAI